MDAKYAPMAEPPAGAVWINAGEASGDMHGASLAREILQRRPGWTITGMGGPAMQEAGCRLAWPMSAISLVGLTEVLPGLPRILNMLRRIKQQWKKNPPKAVVLIDCPDFNFQLAKIARKLGVPAYYYISPQVWAWRSGRVKFLEKNVRKVLCILPFEQRFYAERGVDAEFVGHPLLDAIGPGLFQRRRDPLRVGLLPGSRSSEIASLLPELAGAARIVRRRHPGACFSLFRAPHISEDFLQRFWDHDIPARIIPPEDRHEAMADCSMALAASGTVALELALVGTPSAICYKVSALTAFLAKRIVKVKYVSLPNLLLDREVFPELLLERANAAELGAVASWWLGSPETLARVREDLFSVRTMLGEAGAAGRAADMMINDLDEAAKTQFASD